MRIKKHLLGIFLMIALVVVGSVNVSAAWVGYTYFENVNSNGPNLIWPPDLTTHSSGEGRYSIPGSVMPNLFPGTTQANGAGAIGTRALGINPGDNNQVRKQKLYDFLENKNKNGTEWERMGSALIVHQMLERSWGAGGRTIPPEDWVTLHDRLVKNEAIIMSREDHAAHDNTSGARVRQNAGSPWVYDASKYTYSFHADVDAWVFYNGSAKVYAIEIICANPLGSLSGLPPYVPPEPPVETEYDLTPSGSINKEVVEPDDSVEVTNTVRNSGSDDSEPTIWRLTEMIYEPGAPLGDDERSARDSANDPCGSFISGGRTECETVQESTDEIFGAGSSKTYNPIYNYVVPSDMPVGTRVCFTVSVSRPTQEASPVWRHDTLRCIMVGKKPKMQVWGGDVRVGGNINTSTNRFSSSGTTYGSWAEYAALSNGANSGLATGSGLNGGNPSDEQCSWSALTLANTLDGENCRFGRYNFTLSSHTLASQFTVTSSTVLSGSRDLNSLPSGVYGTNATEDPLTLTGTTIGSGKSVIIKSTKTVIITGDIVYHNGPYSNARDIPQVVIQAPEIRIMGNVHRVDAWLLALDGAGNGILNTCGDVAIDASLTADMCNEQLTVNGPVVADKIYLQRTAGSNPDGARDAPGEIFNLRADAYLWGNRYGIGSGGARTVHIKELPPRF